MNEIKCPKCGEIFQVDERGYAQIVKQIRDEEFEADIHRRLEELEQKKNSEISLAVTQREAEFNTKMAEKDQAIAKLEAQVKSGKTEEQLAVSSAVNEKEREKAAALAQKEKLLAEKEKEIAALQAKLANAETEKALAVSRAEAEKDRQISQQATAISTLNGQLEIKNSERELSEKALKEQYEDRLRIKDEQIEYYKDFKARQSTKMVGESLEQHCQTLFNAQRMAAFPNAYFEKDNDAKTGSKGDFIFRESQDGVEFISIMFEMKNEMDTTATKHKNEDFFKELDKDRREKNCEYAVLVSLLESDSELYNNGIVDVSYRYPKMFVVRPQFFMPIISLLRNAALNSLQYQKELLAVRNQQVDLNNFEENMNAFKTGFAKNYELASRKFQDAIDDIDKTIKALEKTKNDLLSSDRNLRLANDKAQDLSIKKLTKNAPSVTAMFEQAQQNNQ